MGDWRKAHVIGCKVWEGEYTCSCPPVRAILPNASIAEWCEAAHDNSVAHGFGDNPIPTRLMLIVTEAAEAMEEWRKQDDLWRDHFAEELADVCLRVFDLAEHMGLDLEAAIHKKHLYNLTRPFKHGGKLA